MPTFGPKVYKHFLHQRPGLIHVFQIFIRKKTKRRIVHVKQPAEIFFIPVKRTSFSVQIRYRILQFRVYLGWPKIIKIEGNKRQGFFLISRSVLNLPNELRLSFYTRFTVTRKSDIKRVFRERQMI